MLLRFALQGTDDDQFENPIKSLPLSGAGLMPEWNSLLNIGLYVIETKETGFVRLPFSLKQDQVLLMVSFFLGNPL